MPELRSRGFREVIVGSYRIVYDIKGQEVIILRVWHSRRDLEVTAAKSSVADEE